MLTANLNLTNIGLKKVKKKKSVSKTYHSAKNMHTALFLFYFLNRQLQNCCLTLYQTTNFRPFQTERVADDNSKFDENGKELSKWVENTVGKG